jgi:AraC-like DNA-binding protein
MLHVTTNHLNETVKGTLGQPAGMIIRERLLLEAKRLLRYSDSPVAEIATHLNFEDPSYFSRFFKKHTGFSPSEFREQP